jgi:ribosomal protein L32E
MRTKERAKPFLVSIGYRSPRAVRGWHPRGAPEILVHTVRDIDRIAGENQEVEVEVAQPSERKSKRKLQPGKKLKNPEVSCVLRIGSGVGSRKKLELVKAAQNRNLYVANPKITVAKVSSLEELESLLPIKNFIKSWYVSEKLTEDEREKILGRAEEVGIEVVE